MAGELCRRCAYPIKLGLAPVPFISPAPSLSQSIYQDDEKEKLKGVYSLIKYAMLCKFMLIPTEESSLTGNAAMYPEDIPGYGERGWHAAPGYPNRESSPKPLMCRTPTTDLPP